MPSNQSFIERWQHSAAAERANYALFLSELCDFLDVPRPEPTLAEDHRNQYVFEKNVTFHHLDGTTSTGRIDLYKRAHFILEAKQGSHAPEANTATGATGEFTLTPPTPRPVRRGSAPPFAAPSTGTKRCSRPTTRPSATPRLCPPPKAGRRSSSPSMSATPSSSSPTSL